jgi:hypothetical protein
MGTKPDKRGARQTKKPSRPKAESGQKPRQTPKRKVPTAKKKAADRRGRTSFSKEVVPDAASEAILPVLQPFMPHADVGAAPVRTTFIEIPGLKDAQAKLAQGIKDFMDKVGNAIQKTTVLEVKTYVSDNIEGIHLEGGKLEGDTRMRALTTIDLDGDIVACVPMRPEGIDTALWAVHVDLVRQAQANRAELIKMALSAVSGILSALKPL